MNEPPRRLRRASSYFFLLFLLAFFTPVARADRPYAPTRDYNLENVRVSLRFDLGQRKVIGEVTHTLSTLRDGITDLDFDSADLTIQSARVNGQDARFDMRGHTLIVHLPQPAKAGEKFVVDLKYQGRPTTGLYFILPDKGNPNRPAQIWTQGEAEDTHHYIPIYDYPNNRTTTEMILTVPANWLTVSNGTLESVQDAPGGMKTWTWRQALPVPTYLISVAAGQFDEKKETWNNIPVNFYVPKGDGDTIGPTFERTPQMLEFFSKRFGVPYPWVKYDQVSVDDFVASGMENVSATTLSTRDLIPATLAGEKPEGADNLISHELTHQWFGDLVTCRDWAHTWLNEGFATFGATLWEEHEYGSDAAAYRYWRMQNRWMRSEELYSIPVVTHNFTDSIQYAGNVYNKGAWVLRMLREQMGDDAFFHALKYYLQANRLHDVVTADLIKAIEKSTGISVDRFFDQWIYGAGAPRFQVSSAYDAAKRTVSLNVRQTQTVQGRVEIFRVPVDVAITTASGQKIFPIEVSKAEQTFSFTVDGPPLMVLFDKGDKVLKSLVFQKSPEEWIRQIQTAQDVPDRADAAVALGAIQDNAKVVSALGEAARKDPFWGVRQEALRALGRIGSTGAREQILDAFPSQQPWVRQVAVQQLSRFSSDQVAINRLHAIYREDKAYSVKTAALESLAQLKAPGTAELLQKALSTDSPGDVLARGALIAMGTLNDGSLAPVLLKWSSPSKSSVLRGDAIWALGHFEPGNHQITQRLVSYLKEPSFDIRFSTIEALRIRGDPTAIEPLQELLNSGRLALAVPHEVQELIEKLKAKKGPAKNQASVAPSNKGAGPTLQTVMDRLERLDRQMTEVNNRLQKIEAALPASGSQ